MFVCVVFQKEALCLLACDHYTAEWQRCDKYFIINFEINDISFSENILTAKTLVIHILQDLF